jgi:hypothetical protein
VAPEISVNFEDFSKKFTENYSINVRLIKLVWRGVAPKTYFQEVLS